MCTRLIFCNSNQTKRSTVVMLIIWYWVWIDASAAGWYNLKKYTVEIIEKIRIL